MTDLAFRPAVPSDKARILEIAAQMWEGDDYIPAVIDEWLKPPPAAARLIVATIDGHLVALARYDRTFPSYAWFEGLRTDPGYQNRGLAKALTGHLIDRARADGAARIGLSTYFDNYPSQKVTAAYGFRRVASFAACSAEGTVAQAVAAPSSEVISVVPAEAAAYIATSATLQLGNGFLPHSWRFYPFALDPMLALSYMAQILGIRRGSELVALVCVGDTSPHGPGSFSIDFMDGDPIAVEVLVRHAFHSATDARYVEAMVPARGGETGVGLQVISTLGIKSWNNGQEDVLVCELDVLPAPLGTSPAVTNG